MKKLIVLSVIFALVAGAVFAQEVNVGGGIQVGAELIKGTTQKDADDKTPDPEAAGEIKRGRIQLSGQNEAENFGGRIRFNTGGFEDAFAWWKPIDMVRLFLGQNGDGEYTMDPLCWGFYAEAGDILGMHNSFGTAYAGNILGGTDFGMIVTISPMEGLDVSFAVPYGNKGKAEYVYKKFVAQVTYAMEGLGKFGLRYKGGIGEIKSDDAAVPAIYLDLTTPASPAFVIDPTPAQITAGGDNWVLYKAGKKAGETTYDPGALYAYFELAMIENLFLDFGFRYTFNGDDTGGKSWKNPMGVGLTARYDMDPFGVKARVESTFGGDDKALTVFFEVLPYYAVSESLTAYLGAGLSFLKPDDGDNVVNWHINPYLSVNEGNATFYAGFKLNGFGKDGQAKSYMNWGIPIGIAYNF